MKFFRVFAVVTFSLLISPVANAMVISEIYYDPVGTDTGHEFVEMYNDSSESVDITGWKFFEADSNHGLTVINGDMILEAGEYAVIADQPAQIAADFSGIGTLLDSAFSLNNTGETIALKNASLEVVDQVLYTSASGGSQDSMSLNLIGSSWAARIPSPGTSPSSQQAIEEDDTETEAGSDDEEEVATDESDIPSNSSTLDSVVDKDNDPKTKDPKYTLSLQIENVISAHDPVMFEGILMRDDNRLLTGKFEWSLGDGTTLQKKHLKKFEYSYNNPGTYMVVLEYYKNSFDDVPFLRTTKKISVLSGDITIASVEKDGSIILKNNENKDIDLSGWRFVVNGNQFIFGKNTFILAKDSLAISPSVHRLYVNASSHINLQNPDRLVAAQYPKREVVFSDSVNEDAELYNGDLSRIQNNSQQANVVGSALGGMWPWLLGLLGILIAVGAGCVVLLLKEGKKDVKIDTPPLDPVKSFSSDEIELLM